ncbi:chemotaxis protein CheW [Ancylothrix sp. C2]|nr:chemotaxis protein CheW [Ancylothrix sp. D3o]
MNSFKYSRRFRTKHEELPRITTEKFLVFNAGNERYAIPLLRVLRVVKEFIPQGVLISGRSLVKEQNDTIVVFDVSTLLSNTCHFSDCNFLIVCSLNNSVPVGIPIPDMPAILEVSPEQFSEVPELYRQGQLSTVVDRLIHVSESVVFYLNLDKLVGLASSTGTS